MILKKAVYIADAKRLAIGKFLGTLSDVPAVNLSTPILNYYKNKYPFLKNKTDQIIIGNVLSAGVGMNLARMISYQNSFSFKIPAMTLNYVCGSGLRSIIEAAKSIVIGESNIVIAGGVESMSNAPYLLSNARKGYRFGNNQLIDSIYHDGLYCSLAQSVMGETAELITQKYKITRENQDIYALNSHKQALLAIAGGDFTTQIVGYPLQESDFINDEQPRKDTTLEKLAKLKPIFKKSGSVTAGNSSSLNDGAALALLLSERAIKRYHTKPVARIIAYNYLAIKPQYMGIAPYYSISQLLVENKMRIDDVDHFEINEAFAAQILAVEKLLNLNPAKVNINGGAIALGHPLGATGAILLTKLVYNLISKNKKFGIVSLCIGGGQGISLLIEKL